MVNKCSKCGWEYPETHTELRCRFCGTAFTKTYCISCKTLADVYRMHMCRKCYSTYTMMHISKEAKQRKAKKNNLKKKQLRIDSFNSWLEAISKAPFKSLTNDEWLSACTHFGKCAICGSEHIDARAFFIPYYYGGRYAAWNVIPVCDCCALKLRRRQNPWVSIPEAVPRITEYLQPILEEVLPDESTESV